MTFSNDDGRTKPEYAPSEDKSTNYTVKTTESVKAKFDQLAEETNLSKKDLFAKVVEVMSIEVTKNVHNDFTSDIEEFAGLTQRLYKNFTQIIERMVSIRETDQQNFNDILEKKQEDYTLLHAKIAELKSHSNELAALNTDMKQENEQLTLRLQEAQKSVDTVQLLVDEYKEKNDLLLGNLNKLKHFEFENEELRNERITAVTEKIDLQKQVDKLKEQLALEAKQKPLDIQAAVLSKQAELQAVMTENTNQQQAVIQGYLFKIDQLHEAHDAKIEKQIQSAINERVALETKIDNLTQLLEKERAEKSDLVEQIQQLKKVIDTKKEGS